MTGSKQQRGFALLIAVILASVAVAVGIALSSIAYKSVRLSDVAQGSEYAFYAADSALECALYADQQGDAFDYNNEVATGPTNYAKPVITCTNDAGSVPITLSAALITPTPPAVPYFKYVSQSPSGYSGNWFPVVGGRCARLTITKASDGKTFLYAEGITDCNTSNPRDIERGVYAHY